LDDADAGDHSIQLSAHRSLNAADEYELIPTHSAPWSREKVLNGKIWKKVTLENMGICVHTADKVHDNHGGNRKRQIQTYQDF
jgi:hypothetical protein